MACRKISVNCDISNPMGCGIDYNDCFGNPQLVPIIPVGDTALLDGTIFPCAEDGTVVSTNGTLITLTIIDDCNPISPTPTETPTPTPTPTEPYDIYLFEDCCDSSNKFRIENIPGTLNEGEVFDINEDTGIEIREGDVEFTNLSPYDVVFDTTKETTENHDWVLTRSFRNKFDLAAKFPEMANKIKEEDMPILEIK